MADSHIYFEPEPAITLRVNDRKQSAIERIIPVPELNALLVCEQDFGATLWESSGSMAIRARLLHGHVRSTVGDRMGIKRDVANSVSDFDPGKIEKQMLQRGEHETGVTVPNAVYAPQLGSIITSGMDSKLCIWGRRSPHRLVTDSALHSFTL